MRKPFFRTWAHLSLLAANIIYGLNYSIAKAVMPDYIKPFALVSVRSIFGAALFWITSLFLPGEKVSRKDLLYLFGCSFFGVVINQVLFLVGLDLIRLIESFFHFLPNFLYNNYELTKKITAFIEKNFDNVGSRFATEALKIHYGVTEPRNIRGTSTHEEEKTLKQEGIEFIKIPVVSDEG